MSPLTRFSIVILVYKYWLRDLIILKIKYDRAYESLLKFTDYIMLDRKDGDRWEY